MNLDNLSDLDIKRAEIEARSACKPHCWHSALGPHTTRDADDAADNHDALCCACGIRSEPTVTDEQASASYQRFLKKINGPCEG